MAREIQVDLNKTLKLSNVLCKEIQREECNDLPKTVIMMENYIRSKGAMPIGPMIQYEEDYVNKDGEIDTRIIIMRQCSNFINKVETPYKIMSQIRVTDCLYAHFIGEINNLNFAYNKLTLMAYENSIMLKGNSYTIFVKNEEDTFIVDVFMEKAKNE